MFLKKKIFLIFVLILVFRPVFSQSKSIQNLTLDFEREELPVNGSKSIITGNLSYQQNPYAFAFQITSPKKQLTFLNSEGCFFKDDKGISSFENGYSILKQTEIDFLTWFKSDLGISQAGYKPTTFYKDGDFTVTKWVFVKNEIHPIEYIEVYTDKNFTFTRMKMYLADGSISTDTVLSDFKLVSGYYFPQKVTSTMYSNNEEFVKIILTFKNVLFNQQTKNQYAKEGLAAKKENDSDVIFKNLTAVTKPAQNYSVSITSNIAHASFSFYKTFITKQDTSNCPFEPSCSQYMLQAISENGLFGIIQGLERLKRCTTEEHSRNLYPVTDNHKHADPYIKNKSGKKK